MFGSKSLNVPFLLKCDPRPQRAPNIGPKVWYICTPSNDMCYWTGVRKILEFKNPKLSPTCLLSSIRREMAKPYLSLQEPHISTPYSHYTSLFNSARFHSDRCDVKSLCKLWCYFSVKSLEVLFVRRHSFQERQPTPNHNLNKVCIQKIFQTFFRTHWVITG